jgi:hypothetical protein
MIDLCPRKRKLLPAHPRGGSSRSLIQRCSGAPCPLARRAFGSQHASGRSPDLVSQRRLKINRTSLPPAAFPIRDQWPSSRRLREHHSGGTARESHPLPYSPRTSGHPKHYDDSTKSRLRTCKLSLLRGQSQTRGDRWGASGFRVAWSLGTGACRSLL